MQTPAVCGVSHAGTGRAAQIGVPHGVRVRLCSGHNGTKQTTTTARHRSTSILHPHFIPPGEDRLISDSVETFGMLSVLLVFTPKGWDNLAWGNAPGRSVFALHPEGVGQFHLSQAYSLENQ